MLLYIYYIMGNRTSTESYYGKLHKNTDKIKHQKLDQSSTVFREQIFVKRKLIFAKWYAKTIVDSSCVECVASAGQTVRNIPLITEITTIRHLRFFLVGNENGCYDEYTRNELSVFQSKIRQCYYGEIVPFNNADNKYESVNCIDVVRMIREEFTKLGYDKNGKFIEFNTDKDLKKFYYDKEKMRNQLNLKINELTEEIKNKTAYINNINIDILSDFCKKEVSSIPELIGTIKKLTMERIQLEHEKKYFSNKYSTKEIKLIHLIKCSKASILIACFIAITNDVIGNSTPSQHTEPIIEELSVDSTSERSIFVPQSSSSIVHIPTATVVPTASDVIQVTAVPV